MLEPPILWFVPYHRAGIPPVVFVSIVRDALHLHLDPDGDTSATVELSDAMRLWLSRSCFTATINAERYEFRPVRRTDEARLILDTLSQARR